ncbi:LON peptidase substrate-binding domain-containing protein [Gluconobacter morbifer]|uniref:ATP-dependent protease La n=1 Tax=Gluconobacter morbifer G707 TaxID=1088869 RepID=G6XJR2_9PROT|nr:LON peptidase substrate-binding domain-containing protein [Gluconobacter morbifer]EHH67874.1 ATP-dependent protease La [Gluconobacter morbifer G707]
MTNTSDMLHDEDDTPRRVPPITEMTLADIPPRVGLFPLSGALLMPEGRLPLVVFEPRYVSLVEDALADRRLIGMIQPLDENDPSPEPELHRIGTLGRISDFSEHADGTFSITLLGICRFRLLREAATDRSWRQGLIDASPFAGDMVEDDPLPVTRKALLDGLKRYLAARQLKTTWSVIEEMDDDMLLVVLPMLVPFSADEKQTLLEAITLDERAGVLLELLERGME